MHRGLLSVLESGSLALVLSAVMLVAAVAYGLYTNHQAKAADAAPVVQKPHQPSKNGVSHRKARAVPLHGLCGICRWPNAAFAAPPAARRQ